MNPSEDRFAIPIEQELDFSECHYPIRLALPTGREYSFEDARKAVKAE